MGRENIVERENQLYLTVYTFFLGIDSVKQDIPNEYPKSRLCSLLALGDLGLVFRDQFVDPDDFAVLCLGIFEHPVAVYEVISATEFQDVGKFIKVIDMITLLFTDFSVDDQLTFIFNVVCWLVTLCLSQSVSTGDRTV